MLKCLQLYLQVVADNHYHQRLLLTGITRWREFNREMKQRYDSTVGTDVSDELCRWEYYWNAQYFICSSKTF